MATILAIVACSGGGSSTGTGAGDGGTSPAGTTPAPPSTSGSTPTNPTTPPPSTPSDGGVDSGGGAASCEALCAHIEATVCPTKNTGTHADCLTLCEAKNAKGPQCSSQANALIACCTTVDLTPHCTDNVLDPRDCDDDDACPTQGAALDACN